MSLRLAFVGGSLRGDIEYNTQVLENLTQIAMQDGFLPMCFARASLVNMLLWENDPEQLEQGQCLVDGVVRHVAETGGVFFVRQRDDGTYSDGTLRELALFRSTPTSLTKEVRAYRVIPGRGLVRSPEGGG